MTRCRQNKTIKIKETDFMGAKKAQDQTDLKRSIVMQTNQQSFKLFLNIFVKLIYVLFKIKLKTNPHLYHDGCSRCKGREP